MDLVKVVPDTNVLISAFIFPGGPPERVFQLAVARDIALGVSAPLLDELAGVLRKKFRCSDRMLAEVTALVRGNGTLVEPAPRLRVITDEPDNRVLECAVSFGADFIVSGDHHLLKLKKYQTIEIIRAAEFVARMTAERF
jgi:putative PIN family toxin of toxin-antitoxin system